MSITASARILDDPLFRDRVKVAGAKVAVYRLTQATDSAELLAFAYSFIRNPDAYVPALSVVVAANPNVGTGTSDPATDDSALEYVIGTEWERFAVAPAADA